MGEDPSPLGEDFSSIFFDSQDSRVPGVKGSSKKAENKHLKIHSERILPLSERDLARPVKSLRVREVQFNGANELH
jgi:hypothetical protein